MKVCHQKTSQLNSMTHLKKLPHILKVFQNTEQEGILLNSSCEVGITLRPRSDEMLKKKKN